MRGRNGKLGMRASPRQRFKCNNWDVLDASPVMEPDSGGVQSEFGASLVRSLLACAMQDLIRLLKADVVPLMALNCSAVAVDCGYTEYMYSSS
jgi:hypothetical protein